MDFIKTQAETAIEIPFRNDGNGKGAYYDHKTIRSISGRSTVASVPPGYNMLCLEQFNKELIWCRNVTIDQSQKIDRLPKEVGLPQKITSKYPESSGLLVITGHSERPKDKKFHDDRINHEMIVLRHAILTGRPVIGICAGSWKLADAHAAVSTCNENNKAEYYMPVDHQIGQMPSFNSDGSIAFNHQVHSVSVDKDSLLASAMKITERSNMDKPVSVNSVHWLSLKSEKLPKTLVTSAKSKKIKHYQPIEYKTERILQPEDDCVEAFESKFGAPCIGIQWHPEAYCDNIKASSNQQEVESKSAVLTNIENAQNDQKLPASNHSGTEDIPKNKAKIEPSHVKKNSAESMCDEQLKYNPHANIFDFMAKAGDTWNAKRQMLSELHQRFASTQSTIEE